MLKKTIFIASIMACFCRQKEQILIPYLDNGKYGYSDINGEIVITPKYDRVEQFNADGIALTTKANQIIYIDKTGKEFLSLDNSNKASFYLVLNSNSEETNRKYIKDTLHDLRLIYFNDKRFHFLNIKTYKISNRYYKEFIIQSSAVPNFYYINFKYGYFVGKINDNEYEVLNANGEVILKTTNKPIIWNEELISYNDKNGTVLFNPKKNTKISIPYTIVHEIIEDKYLIISNGNPSKHYFNLYSSNKKGLINTEGQLILDTIYNELYKSVNNRLIAKNFYTYLIDYNGNIISPSNQYTNISLCENNSFISTLINGKKVLTDSNGKLLINDSYDEIKYHNADKYFTWKKGEYSGIIDSNHQHVVNFKCDAIYSSSNKDYFYVNKANKLGIIDIHQKVILPIEYDRCYLTHDKFIEIFLDGKVGLAKLNGKILFQPLYEEIEIENVKNQIYFRPKKDNSNSHKN
ncbi:MAG TPA: WG repeat-containing protein [Saprospiraceae bacterium]|nr:WG repeat-containing protein [Saprospiraceae bacterium]